MLGFVLVCFWALVVTYFVIEAFFASDFYHWSITLLVVGSVISWASIIVGLVYPF
jgi:hypothetical protein